MPTAMPVSLSPSKLTAFKDCPRAFRFASIDHLPEISSPHLVLGTLVHLALQYLYEEPVGKRRPGAGPALALAWNDTKQDPDFLGLGLLAVDEDAMLLDASNLLANALKLEDPDSVDVRSNEQMLEAVVDGVLLRGKIDRLDNLPGGGFGVVDYKTGWVPGRDKERQKMEGVYFYALLCEQVFGYPPKFVRLDYQADPVSVTCEVNPQMIRAIRQRAGAAWAAIAAAAEADDFRPNPSPLCSWCSYRALCPLFGGKP